jgi:hypothetical protein
MLVERNQFAERLRRQSLGQDRIRRTIPFECAMRYQPLRRTICSDLLRRPAKRESLGLRKHIGQPQVVMIAKRVERLSETYEVARDEFGALMDELIKRVLAIRARLAQVDRSGLIVDLCALQGHVLAIALHDQLLKVGAGKRFRYCS